MWTKRRRTRRDGGGINRCVHRGITLCSAGSLFRGFGTNLFFISDAGTNTENNSASRLCRQSLRH